MPPTVWWIMQNILLIDGKNTAYRALFAARGNREFRESGYHPFVVWLRFTHVWLEEFKPDSVHVFWDCPKDHVWRKRVFKEYKDQRETMMHYDNDVQADMHNIIDSASDILPYMGVRQYLREGQESDDLIYSACRAMAPGKSDTRKVIVVSSDSDFLQLAWYMQHVVVYEPKHRKFVELSDIDPAMQKALTGDRADNIDGYRGIGPVKSRQLLLEMSKLFEFLNAAGVDKKKFRRNLALIDLSLNPSCLSNLVYVMRVMAEEVKFDKASATKMAMKHKVNGFLAEYPSLAVPFKRLT